MFRLIETIKLKDGVLQNIRLHNKRMNHSRFVLFGWSEDLILNKKLLNIKDFSQGIFKCRVLYNTIIQDIEIIPYKIKVINTLKLVFDNSIDYSHKYEDRECINRLFKLKEKCDDVLVIKDGYVTDTSYCNIVFDTGTRLITPSTPLLKGIKREVLLTKGKFTEEEIKYTDIKLFKKAYLINSMIDLHKIEIPIKNII